MHNKQYTSGFTLIETLVSMLVLSFLLLAATTLMTRTITANTISQDRYLAARLAAEGIELIKVKRNRNMEAGLGSDSDPEAWKDNLIGTWEVDSTQKLAFDVGETFLAYNPLSGPRILCKRTSPMSEAGKYSHSCADGVPVPGNFTRVLEVYDVGHEYSVQVTATVEWNSGADKLEVSSVLYKLR